MQGEGLRFVPSKVEGLRNVKEVAVYPDRLEVLLAGHWKPIRFADIAQWPYPARLRRWLSRFGYRPTGLPVGERDWFHPPAERFFRFYADPPVVVFLPDEPTDTDYGSSLFRRVQDVILKGGFSTWDLG